MATASTATPQDLDALVRGITRRAREAAFSLAALPAGRKNAVLARLASGLHERRGTIQEANARDIEAAPGYGLTDAQTDRLRLTDERIDAMIAGVRQVLALPDPVGVELERLAPANGLDIRKVRVPIGVIGIIYESRPNVTVDCAILCLKSGNAAVLRGGKEAFHSNTCLAGIVQEALEAEGVDPAGVQFIPTTDRSALNTLLTRDEDVHCIIPRGGKGLIRFVVETSTIPVIKHYDGICAVYLDRDADPVRAVSLTVDAKTQRTGVCNAAETLWVDRSVANALLPEVARALVDRGVELRVTPEVARLLGEAGIPCVSAGTDDFDTEFLALVMAVGLVDGVDDAVSKINRHGSGHSDLIVTENAATAATFLNGVDGAAVFWNASTRFNDGFEFGLGAEIGISTDRLHARGPMGLNELCTYKYQVYGHGQTKGGGKPVFR
ncbi:MAG: glutamate-5-semialdehyde dehydrogenase [Opitutales bacterium]